MASTANSLLTPTSSNRALSLLLAKVTHIVDYEAEVSSSYSLRAILKMEEFLELTLNNIFL